jgi:hypothetical protein
MKSKNVNNVKIFMISLLLCLIAVPFSRYISPRAIVNGHDVYLAWLPLSVMLAVILLFGRRAIIPILLSFTAANIYNINLAVQHFLPLPSLSLACGVIRWRWVRQVILWHTYSVRIGH